MTVILASQSPQRRRILQDLGPTFDVRPSDVPELSEGEPNAVAVANAVAKASAITADSGDIVIGCDTVVATDAGLWGKPVDRADAERTLAHLDGITHRVVSGVAVIRDGQVQTATETTSVTFRPLSDAVVERYLDSGEWEGRAGAYAIQGAGAVLVERVDGDLLNVIGLPVSALLRLAPELV